MKQIDILVDGLKGIFGENLVSVVLYGENNSVLVIFKKLEASDIKQALPVIKKWIKTKNPLPVIMSEDEWLASADIYPVEYTEIMHNYKILHGKDPVEKISVKKPDLRLKCEYEIKNILVKIRQLYLGNSDNPRFMAKTLEETAVNTIRILKSALYLFDLPAQGNYREILQKISEKADFDSEIFLKILSLKENNKKIPLQELEESIKRIINSIYLLYNFINNWKE